MGCRGLTAIIKKNYFSNYKYTFSGTQGENYGKHVPRDKQGGMARGRRVDNDVERWIKASVRPEASKRAAPQDILNRKHKQPHVYAQAFIALMKKLDLTPLGAQVVVRDEACNLATLVDGVFLNRAKRVVLIELKCGFEGYNETSSGKMHAPFGAYSNAPCNQHQLQLAFTRCLFERTFPEFGKVGALLVRMTNTGAHVHTIRECVDRVVRRIIANAETV